MALSLVSRVQLFKGFKSVSTHRSKLKESSVQSLSFVFEFSFKVIEEERLTKSNFQGFGLFSTQVRVWANFLPNQTDAPCKSYLIEYHQNWVAGRRFFD